MLQSKFANSLKSWIEHICVNNVPYWAIFRRYNSDTSWVFASITLTGEINIIGILMVCLMGIENCRRNIWYISGPEYASQKYLNFMNEYLEHRKKIPYFNFIYKYLEYSKGIEIVIIIKTITKKSMQIGQIKIH